MSGDHDACPNCGAGAMWCDCDPDRKVEREAYIRGAKDVLEELSESLDSGNTMPQTYIRIAKLRRQIERGEWPKAGGGEEVSYMYMDTVVRPNEGNIKKLEQSNERAENERMMQDHIRLCTALGLDADANVDMLAEAAEGLRAECERLHEQVSSHAGWLWCCREDLKCAEKCIAELTAALVAIDLLSSQGFAPALTEIGKVAAAALKGDTSEIRRRASPDDKHPEDRIVH